MRNFGLAQFLFGSYSHLIVFPSGRRLLMLCDKWTSAFLLLYPHTLATLFTSKISQLMCEWLRIDITSTEDQSIRSGQ